MPMRKQQQSENLKTADDITRERSTPLRMSPNDKLSLLKDV